VRQFTIFKVVKIQGKALMRW